jgi:hypothetical protein
VTQPPSNVTTADENTFQSVIYLVYSQVRGILSIAITITLR